MGKLKRLTASVMLLAMVLSLAACTGKGTEIAMELGEYKVTGGMYLGLQLDGYTTAAGKVDDEEKDVFKQKIDGKKAADYIREETVNATKYYLVIEKMFDERKLKLTDSDTSYAEQFMNYQWAYYQEYYESNGVGYDSLKKLVTNQIKAEAVFKDIYGDKGEKKVTAKQLRKFFDKNFEKVQYSAFPLQNDKGEKVSDETKKQIEDKVKEFVKKANNKGDFAKLAKTYLTEAAKMAGTTFDSTSSSAANTELFNTKEESQYFSEDLIKKMSDKKIGVVDYVVEDDRIVVYKRQTKKDSDYKEKQDGMLVAMKGDEFKDYVKSTFDKQDFVINDKAIKYYNPKKIKEYKANNSTSGT